MKLDPLKISCNLQGKIEIKSKVKVTDKNLGALYTPGVALICKKIVEDKKFLSCTIKKNTIAVISDGSAVLGLGNIGPEAALPVMEGKALLFKELGGINAFPIVLNTQDTEEIIKVIKAIAPTFGGINLEDIAAPKCFEIEKRLKDELDIPVMHDDQHATAIVVLAGLINALKVVKKDASKIKLTISGSGAAGTAIIKLLRLYGVKNILACDSKGIINKNRKDLNSSKKEIAEITNYQNIEGTLKDAIIGADVFVGVSGPNILTAQDVSNMAKDPIVFAMANPVAEIQPAEAKKGGVKIMATGSSNFPNQLNNVLAFPGVFKGLLENNVKKVTDEHKLKAAKALAGLIKNPTANRIVVKALDKKAVKAISAVFKK